MCVFPHLGMNPTSWWLDISGTPLSKVSRLQWISRRVSWSVFWSLGLSTSWDLFSATFGRYDVLHLRLVVPSILGLFLVICVTDFFWIPWDVWKSPLNSPPIWEKNLVILFHSHQRFAFISQQEINCYVPCKPLPKVPKNEMFLLLISDPGLILVLFVVRKTRFFRSPQGLVTCLKKSSSFRTAPTAPWSIVLDIRFFIRQGSLNAWDYQIFWGGSNFMLKNR